LVLFFLAGAEQLICRTPPLTAFEQALFGVGSIETTEKLLR